MSGDKEIARVKMDGTLHLFTEFVCLKRDVGRHTVLTEEDVTLARRDSGSLGSEVVMKTSEAVGKRMKASLSAGDILYAYHFEAIPLVKRGDMVTIVAQNGSFKVTAPGEARNSGAKGEEVRVKNLTSRRIIRGRVIGPGMVSTSF
jgi:flagella basal body P-ring formation protein FlgA